MKRYKEGVNYELDMFILVVVAIKSGLGGCDSVLEVLLYSESCIYFLFVLCDFSGVIKFFWE